MFHWMHHSQSKGFFWVHLNGINCTMNCPLILDQHSCEVALVYTRLLFFYLVVLIKTEKLKLHSWRFVGTASRNVWYNLICKFQTKQFESGSWKIMFPLTFSLLFNSFLLHNIPYTEKKLPKPLGLDPKCISDLDSGPSKTVVNAVPLQRTSNVKKMTSSYIKQALF